jgi:predicted SAM-dependent methyltransferase
MTLRSLLETSRRLLNGDKPRRAPDRETITAARRIALGSAYIETPGWLATDRDVLDITQRESFARYWAPGTVEAFVAEHVWEHLPPDAATLAVGCCFEFLAPGGTLRIAVPDGFHPDPQYREYVRPGGAGPGAHDHQLLCDHRSLAALLAFAGFVVEPQEWWDAAGEFHFTDWPDDRGRIVRSRRFDSRNQDGTMRYTSLILDGVKPR